MIEDLNELDRRNECATANGDFGLTRSEVRGLIKRIRELETAKLNADSNTKEIHGLDGHGPGYD